MQCKSAVTTAEEWLNPATIKQVFEARALRMAVNCAQNIGKAPSQEEGFSELSPDLLEAVVAHVQLIIVTKFIEKLQQDIVGHGVKDQLHNLCNIYALYLLHKHLGDFLATGCITPKQRAGKPAAREALRSGAAQRDGTGGRVRLHGPLPGVRPGAIRRECVPCSVRGGVEGPAERDSGAGRVPGAPPADTQAVA